MASAIGSVLSGILSFPTGLVGGIKAAADILKPKAAAEADAAPAAVVGPQNADIQARASDFATLEQQTNQRASAAGAVRSDNQADLLGLQPVAKRRSASRALLG